MPDNETPPSPSPDYVALVRTALGEGAILGGVAATLPSFAIAFDQLADIDGWVVWLGHPPVPDDLPLLPVPPELLWGAPLTTLASVAVVTAIYAAKRQVADEPTATILQRECPLTVVVPGDVTPDVEMAVAELTTLGIPTLLGHQNLTERLASVPAFSARRLAHAAAITRRHDPALGFPPIAAIGTIGGNPLSSFVLHHEGERDGVSVIGEWAPRLGIEIGVRSPDVDLPATGRLERAAASIPEFLDGVGSHLSGTSLEIGWREGAQPSASEIGEAFRVWLKALYRLELVDVRLAFAPPQGRSALLTEMRARAAAFKALRTAEQ